MTPAPLPEVVGLSLDGPGHVITRAENDVICATLGEGPAPDGSAHPIWSYIATQVGMGPSIAELCALCAFDVNDGLMLASTETRFERPLRVDQAYRVRGAITGLTRKQSRKLGVMDLLSFRLHLDLPDGTRACSVDNVWVLPRGHDAQT